MIYIEERKTSKIPGETSFFINFSYSLELTKIMSKLECKNYSKKTHEWEIPLNELKIVLDSMCEFEDINLKLLKEEPIKTPKINIIKSNFKTKPFPYQLDGINYGLNHNKWLLLDVPGLGKSLQAILLAEELKTTRNLEHCLIICGINNLKTNWKNEISKHSNLDCTILGERKQKNGKWVIDSVKDRIKHILNPINEFFIITNIETLRDEDFIEALSVGPNKIEMIVVDEIHKANNASAKQSQNLLKLKSTYQLGMTGTPLMNNPLDIYVPLKWIDADRSTLTNFKDQYCIFGDQSKSIIVGYKNLKYLKEQLTNYSLRRNKDILDLPEKSIIPEYIDMNPNQLNFYQNIEKGIVDEVDKVHLTTTSLLAMVTRLRQATACPSILTSENIESSKLERAKELITSILNNNDKVVVFSTFKESIYKLKDMLNEYNPLINTGDTKDNEIDENITKFQNDDNFKLFFGTWQKCGTGLTLTAARYMIFIDTPWTNAAFEQACDRIHRIGTKQPVFIYNLICRGTIDERVLEIINDKGALSDYVVDNFVTKSGLESLKKYIEDLN